jgi:hypothetical protein
MCTYIFLCWIPPRRWPKKAETCRRFTTCLYMIVSNYSAFVGIYGDLLTSEVCKTTVIVLRMAVISDVQMWGGVQYHSDHTMFNEKQSINSEVFRGTNTNVLDNTTQIHFQWNSKPQQRNWTVVKGYLISGEVLRDTNAFVKLSDKRTKQ